MKFFVVMKMICKFVLILFYICILLHLFPCL